MKPFVIAHGSPSQDADVGHESVIRLTQFFRGGRCPIRVYAQLQREDDLVNAIKEAKKLIANDPFLPSAKTLADLVLALESREPFQLERLYALDLSDFDLAVQIVKEWRLDRYYAGKAKLYDFAVQASALRQGGPAAAPAAPAA